MPRECGRVSKACVLAVFGSRLRVLSLVAVCLGMPVWDAATGNGGLGVAQDTNKGELQLLA